MKYLNFFFNYNLNEEFYNYIYFFKIFYKYKIIFQNNKIKFLSLTLIV